MLTILRIVLEVKLEFQATQMKNTFMTSTVGNFALTDIGQVFDTSIRPVGDFY